MNIGDALKALTPVKPGMDVAEVASSSRMNAIMTILRYIADGHHMVTGPGIRKRTGTGWVTITADPQDIPAGGGLVELPFQLIGLVEHASQYDTPLMIIV
jgi:hypothetical protein